MSHSFIHQPDEAGFDLRDAFAEFVQLRDLESIDIVVAWAKQSGIRELQNCIRSMPDRRDTTIHAIIGISLGGTSRQALSDALSLFDETLIYHVPGRTFHPKVYLAKAPSEAIVLVGSHNLTGGGAVNNFEAGVFSRLDLEMEDDRVFYESVATFFERLRSDTGVCRKLDNALLSQLIASDRYPLTDEADPRSRPMIDPITGDQPSEEATSNSGPLFSSSSVPLRTVRSRRITVRRELHHEESPEESGSGSFAGSRSHVDSIVCRWFKQLGAIDAQQPGTGHRSNTMTLVKAGHEIDHTVYFRNHFFQGAQWEEGQTRSGKRRETATITFNVIVDGEDMGDHDFEIRHTPDYASGQSNRTTELRWDQSFGNYLHINPLTGRFVSLERYEDEYYRLIIARHASGESVT